MMIGDASGSMKKRGLDWKKGQMELISWGLDKKIGDLKIERRRQGIRHQGGGFPENCGNIHHEGS